MNRATQVILVALPLLTASILGSFGDSYRTNEPINVELCEFEFEIKIRDNGVNKSQLLVAISTKGTSLINHARIQGLSQRANKIQYQPRQYFKLQLGALSLTPEYIICNHLYEVVPYTEFLIDLSSVSFSQDDVFLQIEPMLPGMCYTSVDVSELVQQAEQFRPKEHESNSK